MWGSNLCYCNELCKTVLATSAARRVSALKAGLLKLPPPTPVATLLCPWQNHCSDAARKQNASPKHQLFRMTRWDSIISHFFQWSAVSPNVNLLWEVLLVYHQQHFSKAGWSPPPPSGSPAFSLPSHHSHPPALLKFSTFTPWETPDALKESWLTSCESNNFSVWQKKVMSNWSSLQTNTSLFFQRKSLIFPLFVFLLTYSKSALGEMHDS